MQISCNIFQQFQMIIQFPFSRLLSEVNNRNYKNFSNNYYLFTCNRKMKRIECKVLFLIIYDFRPHINKFFKNFEIFYKFCSQWQMLLVIKLSSKHDFATVLTKILQIDAKMFSVRGFNYMQCIRLNNSEFDVQS